MKSVIQQSLLTGVIYKRKEVEHTALDWQMKALFNKRIVRNVSIHYLVKLEMGITNCPGVVMQ